jgi:hypothetical protein
MSSSAYRAAITVGNRWEMRNRSHYSPYPNADSYKNWTKTDFSMKPAFLALWSCVRKFHTHSAGEAASADAGFSPDGGQKVVHDVQLRRKEK